MAPWLRHWRKHRKYKKSEILIFWCFIRNLVTRSHVWKLDYVVRLSALLIFLRWIFCSSLIHINRTFKLDLLSRLVHRMWFIWVTKRRFLHYKQIHSFQPNFSILQYDIHIPIQSDHLFSIPWKHSQQSWPQSVSSPTVLVLLM